MKKIIKVILVVGFVGLMIVAINEVNQDVKSENAKRLKSSIEKAAIACFSLEGFYPASLDYLVENYHIIYDSEQYNVHYQTEGANFKPRVEVFERSNYE